MYFAPYGMRRAFTKSTQASSGLDVWKVQVIDDPVATADEPPMRGELDSLPSALAPRARPFESAATPFADFPGPTRPMETPSGSLATMTRSPAT